MKVSFFTWKACQGKVLTLDQFQRIGWKLANRCALCKKGMDSIDHILLHCGKARILWQLVFSIFGVRWVLSKAIRETLLVWHRSFVDKRRIKAWRVAPPCIFQTIWRERNRRFFNRVEVSDQRLKNLFLSNLSLWVRVYIGRGYMNMVDFIDWLGSG